MKIKIAKVSQGHEGQTEYEAPTVTVPSEVVASSLALGVVLLRSKMWMPFRHFGAVQPAPEDEALAAAKQQATKTTALRRLKPSFLPHEVGY
eukprot:6457858-Amphidinium_carterae.2